MGERRDEIIKFLDKLENISLKALGITVTLHAILLMIVLGIIFLGK